ncbi:MAG TPA: DUF4112 domain-containing protein [Alphaproteobacteria bacterium]
MARDTYRDDRRRAQGRHASGDEAAVLRRLERLAWALDASVGMPGTRFRFGLDALLGLVPGIGDVAGAALSAYIVYEGWRLGVPAPALARMIANVAFETVLGSVPVAGDVFDAWWKANLRNIRILRDHLDGGAHRPDR